MCWGALGRGGWDGEGQKREDGDKRKMLIWLRLPMDSGVWLDGFGMQNADGIEGWEYKYGMEAGKEEGN